LSICSVWRILSFPIHERGLTVIHLAIHLENGKRIYFDERTALEKALTAPKKSSTEFFELSKQQNIYGQFARTLLYFEVSKMYTIISFILTRVSIQILYGQNNVYRISYLLIKKLYV